MTTTPVEPLPEGGPTTLGAVKFALLIEDETDDTFLEPIVAAVNGLVSELPVADKARRLGVWPFKVTQGATMLAARLYRRRNSPEGVAAFGNEGPVYVQRNDPDVAMLLELGAWASPQVG